MKQMLEENKLDEDDPTSVAGVTDKEIEQRLAKLKDIDPSKLEIQLKALGHNHALVNFAHIACLWFQISAMCAEGFEDI